MLLSFSSLPPFFRITIGIGYSIYQNNGSKVGKYI